MQCLMNSECQGQPLFTQLQRILIASSALPLSSCDHNHGRCHCHVVVQGECSHGANDVHERQSGTELRKTSRGRSKVSHGDKRKRERSHAEMYLESPVDCSSPSREDRQRQGMHAISQHKMTMSSSTPFIGYQGKPPFNAMEEGDQPSIMTLSLSYAMYVNQSKYARFAVYPAADWRATDWHRVQL